MNKRFKFVVVYKSRLISFHETEEEARKAAETPLLPGAFVEPYPLRLAPSAA